MLEALGLALVPFFDAGYLRDVGYAVVSGCDYYGIEALSPPVVVAFAFEAYVRLA